MRGGGDLKTGKKDERLSVLEKQPSFNLHLRKVQGDLITIIGATNCILELSFITESLPVKWVHYIMMWGETLPVQRLDRMERYGAKKGSENLNAGVSISLEA